MASVSDSLLLAHRRLMLLSYRFFVSEMFFQVHKTKFVFGQHHEQIIKALEKVIRGDTRKLIINIAPRYGKTEIAVKQFISYGLAINPRSKFLHLSYSASLAADNSLSVKNNIMNEYYQYLFNVRFGPKSTQSWWQTSEGGGVYATSTLGQVTGFGAGLTESEEDLLDEYTISYNPDRFSGAIIIDDPIKPEDALSDNARESVNRRFETTIRNRVNSRKTPIVIIMQRLHEHDLCGYLQEIEPDEWEVVSIPAIRTDEFGNEQALWPFKHTIEELHAIEHANEFVFQTQYMQNPTPMEGLMYRPFRTYDELPVRKKAVRFNYTDSADTGSDWLCSICCDVHPYGYYVTDVLYSKKPVEYTEQAMAQMLSKQETERCYVESNNGGRIFMRNVERICREYENRKTQFIPFAQTKNKAVRIFTRANEVNNMIYMPADWERRWPEFAHDVKSYRKEGKNAHDDAPDALTGVIEKCENLLNSVSDEQLNNDFL